MKSEITIVSGLPRSGTSLMMKMLDKGGMEIITDHIRKADIDNPEGYYEFERVKKIKKDVSWLKDTRGKVFKMISMLLLDLPPSETYKIIFMERKMEEILASQKKMLKRKDLTQRVDQDPDDETIKRLFIKHLHKINAWLRNQKNIEVLPIHYNTLIVSPEPEIDKIISFLNKTSISVRLDKEKMVRVIKPELYRNRCP
jgi:hypothetical protein